MQEKQDYIDKIQTLIKTDDRENIVLALQLMESLDLTEEVLSLYYLTKEHIKENIISLAMTRERDNLWEDKTRLLFRIKYTLIFRNYHSEVIRKRVFNIATDMIQILGIWYSSHVEEDANVVIYFHNNYLKFQFEAVIESNHLKELKMAIDKTNEPQTERDLKDLYITVIKQDFKSKQYPSYQADWIGIRRQTRPNINPIGYEVKPYDKDEKLVVFIVKIKLNYLARRHL